ncbi:MFS general substrate transporter [Dendrothele bispora CBS 962.96]|uniref:MFS general substrate transporter n=1 Tax=Dendrothele bispora (strain CBS 962.96) TaxID=1314807 RepID=A0A4S8L058_DENBC|nr:MFS general substrate transporter [Dendrothele bispora CBS 962.96]
MTHGEDRGSSSSSSEYHQSQGVTRMEAVYRAAQGRKTGRGTLYAISISVIVCAWAYSLDQSTTSNYSAFATSTFQQHSSGLASLSIATNIISAVCKPFIAKISDITSRPYTYIVVLCFYVLGYIVVATCRTISAYVIGEVFVAIGSSGLDLLNDIIVADLTTLEWRGFVSSMLSAPFIINTWFAGKIVEALSDGEKWRWGYGMFAIIMPVVLGPAIFTLIYLDRQAQKMGLVNIASSNAARREARNLAEQEGREGPRGQVAAKAVDSQLSWADRAKNNLIEIDAFGLVLLGFGWSLLLLPFSLKTYANGGWHNPSMIAMMVVGGILLICYVLYEKFIATIPSFPNRMLRNKTFMMAIIIDMMYMVAGFMRSLYFSSYTYIVKEWSVSNWTYFNNTMTLALCIFGICAGLIQRWTHRYKRLQIIGLCIKIIGVGILLNGHQATENTAALVISQILIGMGGAFSVVGSRVASQASVPHQDVAVVISLLSLWSKIGASIGSALAAVIWSDKMLENLRTYLPSTVTDAQVTKFFGNIKAIRAYDLNDPIRQGAIVAYKQTLWYLIVPAVALSFIPLIAAFFQTNFYLGKQQNAVMNVAPDGTQLPPQEEPEANKPTINAEPGTFKYKLLKFWAGK